jgi:DNA-binding response OmpR family regulator/HPt (histidine-containing phosphotransfer) domain-containing protein
MKILLIEDDETLTAVLTRGLAAHHYVVDVVTDGEAGWTFASTFEYDLLLMDVMLPQLDGISLCQRLRAEGYTTPILLLTAQDASQTKVKGLDAGADDYVVKPCDMTELVARIRALLRRGSASPFPLLTWGDLCLNPSTCEVAYGECTLQLTTKEYELLELFLRDSQRVLSTDEILDKLWSSEAFPAEATVRSHVRRLRQKLTAAGAPTDFIATIHGRGYYLKSLIQTTTLPTVANPMASSSSLPREQQQQAYFAFLSETWVTTKPKCLNQLIVLLQMAKALKTSPFSGQQQEHAHHIVHQLLGTLGTFGLTQAVQQARDLEQWIQRHQPLQSHHAPCIIEWVSMLKQTIQSIAALTPAVLSSQHLPLLLIADTASPFSTAIVQAATQQGLRTTLTPTLESVQRALQAESTTERPSALLIHQTSTIHQTVPSDEPSAQHHSPQDVDTGAILQFASQQHPDLPTLVVGQQSTLQERLAAVQHGGKLFLEETASPDQILAAVAQLMENAARSAKVMVVDDDQDWLRTLPAILKPWGFKVTTLADPQQFCSVLQAVRPDILLLDVNMPQFNGFELCQVLRSDVQWRRLPILFVSVLTDLNAQNHAFSVGADDYLCKPILGVELARRILNRLQRVQAWAS